MSRSTTQVKVRLSSELHRALQVIAKNRGVTVTALVKRAIRQELGSEKIQERDNASVSNHRL